MKTSIVAAITAGLMATSALAQTAAPPANPPAKTQPAAPNDGRTATKAAPTKEATGPWHVKDFYRSNVYNMAGDKIGDVNDILMDQDGKVTAIIIGVGGFLGLGEKQVSMSPDQVKRMVHSDGKTYFTVNATKDQLKAAPEYTPPKS